MSYAFEGVNTVKFQLTDKETADDIEYDEKQQNLNESNYVEMTTRKEIRSWWLFDWANSPTHGVGSAFVFPIFLAIMAKRYSCNNNTPYGCDWDDEAINSDYTLRVSMGSWQLKPESYASSMIAISSGLQAIAYIMFSALADYGTYKIYLFRITALLTQLMNMSWIFFNHENLWLFAGWWGALANIPSGLCLIFYNAYLLDLVENHWRIRRLQQHKQQNDNDNKSIELMEKNNDNDNENNKSVSSINSNSEIIENMDGDDEDQYGKNKRTLMAAIQDDLSQWGFACGYCGSNIVTIICVLILLLVSDQRAEFIEDVGINSNKQIDDSLDEFNYDFNITDLTINDNEWYVIPVVDVHVWYSVIAMYQNNVSDMDLLHEFSIINGIQFIYKYKTDQFIDGQVFGNNASYNDIIDDDNTYIIDVKSYHESLINPNNENIVSLNIYTSSLYDGLINAIKFNHNDNTDGTLFGIIDPDNNNTAELIQDTLDDVEFILGGYEVTECSISSNYFVDMNIICGFNSIAFVSVDGQYGSTLSLQLSYFIVGLWFLLFSFPSYIHLRSRIRDAIPATASMITISVKSYYSTIKKASSYPDLYRYLIAWFIFSDAIGTTSSCGILFAQTELNMDGFQLILLLLENEITAILGAFFFVWLQKKTGWNTKQILIMHLLVMSFLPFYASFGLISDAHLGLVNVWEMYVFVGIFGFNYGSIFALSRSLYGQFIPKGYESQFFGLYEITDRGSSWIGPMMVALVSNYSSIRWSLIYIVIFYVFAIPLLYWGVDYQRGIKQAAVKGIINENKNDSSSVIPPDSDSPNENETNQQILN